MLLQYCVRPEVEIILFAIIAVKHLISPWTFFHTNIPALGFKRVGRRGNQASKLYWLQSEKKKKSMHADGCFLDCKCFI